MTKHRDTFRCLAIRQPYAWAAAVGVKDIENRSWSTDFRGTFVIQASSHKTDVSRVAKKLGKKPNDPRFVYSALLGVADLVECVPLSPEHEASPWAYGRYLFRIENARLFEKPIPAKGKLNLYHLDETLDAKVREQLPSAKPAVLSEEDHAWLRAMHADPIEQRQEYVYSYAHFERWDEVERLASGFVEIEPEVAFGWGYRGIARSYRKPPELEAGLADLNRAVELTESEDPFWLHHRAMTYGDLGRVEEGKRDVARVRELDPEYFDRLGIKKSDDADDADE